jgi:dTDP-4-dehydrorhamnose 3,5-epimerase
MKIVSITEAKIPGVKFINLERFMDQRGFFSETFRISDFINNDLKVFPNGIMQTNESFSQKNVLRGLHFQWNPNMGKLVRTIHGHMVDLILDLRQGSPTQGKIMAFDMPSCSTDKKTNWIWVPEGCAHGNFFLEDTYIEYFCSGAYNGECEAGISPFAEDIDWSICDPGLKNKFFELKESFIATPKDINGISVKEWLSRKESQNFNL